MFLAVLRVHYAMFGRNLAPIGEYPSCRRFYKFDCGKITNMVSKGYFRPYTLLADTCNFASKHGHGPLNVWQVLYLDLAVIIPDSVLAGEAGDSASVSGSSSDSQQRRRPESIITRPPVPQPKRSRGSSPVKIVWWLMDRMEAWPDGRGRSGAGRPGNAGQYGERWTHGVPLLSGHRDTFSGWARWAGGGSGRSLNQL
jgi:hypothetical protein